jgi:hypothetical protein
MDTSIETMPAAHWHSPSYNRETQLPLDRWMWHTAGLEEAGMDASKIAPELLANLSVWVNGAARK